ncbi:ATP synthase subunit C [Vallitalea okinawensis]|uniref:ATP synthase subunit C n=1 Tax=Vallitalea okinawensis TaxID=2078660 RepID=UPI000CFE1BC9|nr:ATP synthase subunit C [Vallitalea okinawensis]
MNFILFITILLVLTTVVFGVVCTKRAVDGKKVKTFLGVNVLTFFGLLIGATIFMYGGVDASAAEMANEVVDAAMVSTGSGLGYLAAALSTGLACIGAGIAVGVTGSAALGAISENEKLLGKTLIYVGLAEGIAIYGLIISILIIGNL